MVFFIDNINIYIRNPGESMQLDNTGRLLDTRSIYKT